MPDSHRKTCKRFDIDGDAHALTFSCFHRLPLLSKPRSCQWVVESLQRGRELGQYDLWAYVIMPEHVHIILWPHQGVKMKQILTTIKHSVAKNAISWIKGNAPDFLSRLAYRKPNGTIGYRFWQRGGGYDRNLRSITDIYEKIDYIHWNPVRRGLVARAEDWFWSSARIWHDGNDETIGVDRDSLPRLMPTDVGRRSR